MTIASTLPVALTTSVIGPRVTFSVVQACGAEPAQPTGEESARQSGRRSRTLCDGWFIAVLLPLPGANVKAGRGPQSLERTDHGESRTSLTLERSAVGVIGFCTKAASERSTPCRTAALSRAPFKEVHLVTFPSPEAFAASRGDPALKALAPQREASVLSTEILVEEVGAFIPSRNSKRR
jgi:hypothetical protein